MRTQAWKWLMVAGTACVLSAHADTPSPSSLAYAPVAVSVLVSRREPAFMQARVRSDTQLSMVLARRDSPGASTPVALWRVSEGSAAAPLVSVQLLPASGSPTLDVLALEHLYALVVRMEGHGRYCLATGINPCDAAQHAVSQDAVLRELARLRTRVAAQAAGSLATVPWRSVSMVTLTHASSDPDRVAVRLSDDGVPLAGAAVHFNRAPHFGCAARTDTDGVAGCQLIDQHGDDGDHSDHHEHAEVVATYPGNVGADRVLLPTTFVLARRGD